ncbi:helix-turn-helix domain-containing protein [Sphingomonas sp. IC4-52]|uniref:helix-turn-helix domain-containing protein n=1 Tax=Sphingomonas sp. IC4-52 TaxID=2887202 RepID=UPI001D11F9C7|nr:helix-turn-helix transcriptional regulator [Sphingomonas sp. IC4-52]MCC2978886.1 helix-turn-helix domain-containing protein [Sphingomonas sp. IC4-52]
MSARLKQLMELRGLSQSELGRRVGVSQATIYKLLVGESYGTRHLHKIARELLTTPAYLTGETDDPDRDAPPEPLLAHGEQELLNCFRALSPEDHAALTQLARSLSGRARPKTALIPSQIELPPEHALARMFEGLLRVMDLDAPLDEQALLLAQRLPIGLAQLRDLLPASAQPDGATKLEEPTIPVREPQ